MSDIIEILCSEWRTELKCLGESDDVVGSYCKKLERVHHGIESSIDSLKSDLNKIYMKGLSDSIDRIIILIKDNLDERYIKDKVLPMIDKLDFKLFALNLIDSFRESIKDEGILADSLNVKMLAKIISERKFKLCFEKDLTKMYDYIAECKIQKFQGSNKNTDEAIDADEVNRAHQEIAMKFILKTDEISSHEVVGRKIKKVMIEMGLVTEENGQNYITFIHKSFAEYFFSKWLVENANKESVQKIWLQRVMREENFAGVRKFLNGMIDKGNVSTKFSIELLRKTEYFEFFDEITGSNIHLLAREELLALMKLFLYYVNTFPVTISKSLLQTDEKTRNVLHIACRNGCYKIVQLLLRFAEINMSRVTMQRLLHDRDVEGLGPFQLAVKHDKIETIHTFFQHYYHKCTNKTKEWFLMDQTMFADKPLLWATKNNRSRTFEALFRLSKEYLPRDTLSELLFKSDRCSGTILHLAVSKSHEDVTSQILISAKSFLTKDELKKFLFEKNDDGRTVLQVAASCDSIEVVNQVWRFAESTLNNEEIQLFLSEDDEYLSCNTILHAAALNMNVSFAERICELSKSKIDSARFIQLLMTVNLDGETILHSSVKSDSLITFNQIWYVAVRALDTTNLRNLLLKTSNDGSNVLLKAAHTNNEDLLKKLWNYAKNVLDKKSMHNFVFSYNKNRENVFSVAASKGNLGLVKKVWVLLYEISSLDEIEDILVNVDKNGNNVLHMSATTAQVKVLKELLSYANSVLGQTSFRNFLLRKNHEEKTCLQIARMKRNKEFEDQLCSYAKNILSRESLASFVSES